MIKPEKIIFKNTDDLCDGIANWLLETATSCIAERGRFTVALSGGRTPDTVFKRMTQEPFFTAMPWSQCFFFWGDERYVPFSDPQNNAGNAVKLLLGKVPVPEANYFITPTELVPEQAAIAYQQMIISCLGSEAPVFDVVLLGIGDNGHTASLFPHTSVLQETTKLVANVYVDEVKQERITFTRPLINAARQVAFLVAGAAKAQILHKVFDGPYQPQEYPAQFISPADGKLLLFADEAALKDMA